MSETRAYSLWHLHVGSPNIRHLVSTESFESDDEGMPVRVPEKHEVLVMFYLSSLVKKREPFLQYVMLVNERIERLLNRDSSQKNMVSRLTNKLLIDLSFVGECVRQLNTFRPWNSVLTSEDGGKAYQDDFEWLKNPFRRLNEIVDDNSFSELIPTKERLFYPVRERRSREVDAAEG